MKNLTAKQLDAKFAKAAKLAAELNKICDELYEGCDTFKFGDGNAITIRNKAYSLATTLVDEHEMHKANKK